MMISSPSNPAQLRVTCGVPSGSTVTTVASGPVASSSRSESGISVMSGTLLSVRLDREIRLEPHPDPAGGRPADLAKAGCHEGLPGADVHLAPGHVLTGFRD